MYEWSQYLWNVERINLNIYLICSTVHGDLKPENILIQITGCGKIEGEEEGSNVCAKLADFGLSKFSKTGHKSFTNNFGGTLIWSAPEVLDGKHKLVSVFVCLHRICCELLRQQVRIESLRPV